MSVALFLALSDLTGLASQTPDNIWDGNVLAPGGRFVTYAQSVGTDTDITYVPHFNYTAQAYDNLGETVPFIYIFYFEESDLMFKGNNNFLPY